MTIPAIGGVSAVQLGLAPSTALGTTTGVATSTSTSLTGGATQGASAGTGVGELQPTEGASGIESAGGVESGGGIESSGGGESASGGESAAGEGFAGALGKALNALESSQAAGETAAAQVATGTSSDPEAAVVSVSNAELEMQLASQVRTKATEAINSIFQTQV